MATTDYSRHATASLMEAVVEPCNMQMAYKRVMRNKGVAGIDQMQVEDLAAHIRANWASIRKQLLEGTYRPQPVRKVEIPKPTGGVRMLGIPTVVDRLIQQAIQQVLTPLFEPLFSDSSYGFRPKRSTHDAIKAARSYAADGCRWVVDMGLEKFFDRVNHDILMARLTRTIRDKVLLGLIRRYLQAGMMEGGVTSPRVEGVPQGGPLSPLLSNVLLTELDREDAPQAAGHPLATVEEAGDTREGTDEARITATPGLEVGLEWPGAMVECGSATYAFGGPEAVLRLHRTGFVA